MTEDELDALHKIRFARFRCSCGLAFEAAWDSFLTPLPSCPRNDGVHVVAIVEEFPDVEAFEQAVASVKD